MNVKINLEEYLLLDGLIIETHLIGSRLYNTHTEDSDTDVLVIYNSYGDSDIYYPNNHQLQYDDHEDNTQYIYTTRRQFYANLFSGDSTINADVIMFSSDDLTDSEKLNIVRTYNIIKSFIGLAKRDLRFIKRGKSKLFHVLRGLYCAESLMDNKLPDLSEITKMGSITEYHIPTLVTKVDGLRGRMNHLFESGELTMYPKESIIEVRNSLEEKIIGSNNTKEFKY
jgi:hypothetical protein